MVKEEIKTIRMLVKLLAIKMVASNRLGCASNWLAFLNAEGWLISSSSMVLGDAPKKATSEAEIKPEIRSKGRITRAVSGGKLL